VRLVERLRADLIIADPNKWTHEDVTWTRNRERAVLEFEVPIENELEEQIGFAGQYNPRLCLFKLQLLAGEREPIYRFENDKKHHCPDCTWINGPHINRPTEEEPQHGEAETAIDPESVSRAIRQFAQRVNVQLLGAVHAPPAIQRNMDL
jgi:hypothetical protein